MLPVQRRHRVERSVPSSQKPAHIGLGFGIWNFSGVWSLVFGAFTGVPGGRMPGFNPLSDVASGVRAVIFIARLGALTDK
jgi:hypothetical protein